MSMYFIKLFSKLTVQKSVKYNENLYILLFNYMCWFYQALLVKINCELILQHATYLKWKEISAIVGSEITYCSKHDVMIIIFLNYSCFQKQNMVNGKNKFELKHFFLKMSNALILTDVEEEEKIITIKNIRSLIRFIQNCLAKKRNMQILKVILI